MPIEARLYDASGHDTTIDLARDRVTEVRSDQLVWVQVDRDVDRLRAVADALGLGESLARLASPSTRPSVFHGEQSVRLRVIGLTGDEGRPRASVVDFVAVPNVVVTVCDDDVVGLDAPVRDREGETLLGKLEAGAFLAVLLDGLLGGYFDAVERIEAQIDRLDVQALRTNEPDDTLAAMVSLRGDIARLRRALAPQRSVFTALTRPDAELEADLLGAAWPALAQRFQSAVDAVENARELLIGSFDIVMTRVGQRTNDVMRVLTVLSAVLLPSVVLAGVMGMNFHPGFFDTAENFYVVLGLMALLAVVILALGRWRHWL